jgi:hypothetical protein
MCAAERHTKKKRLEMKKQIMDTVIVLTVLLALSGSAFAQSQTNNFVGAPDNCVTSLLLAGAVGGLGLVRKFLR